ncbi:hypothetical protein EVAR_79164_1 [Eumeta japonica]|uniref:Odorant receptor n=1 Tax=Eumeta variegata TaxID=151549 RepID=A0A4C1UT44_EUMVA|nr:hypothetical protein EVAR_79164_1 [Eumeta japonica]
MAPPRFKETFKTAEQALRLIRAYPDIPRDLFWFLQYVVMNIVVGTLFFWLLNSIINHDVPKGDYGEACKNGTMVIVYIVVNTKYWILMSHQRALADLLAKVDDDPRRETYSPEEEAAVTLYAHKKGVFVCKLWIVVAFSIPILLVLHAVLEMCWLAYQGNFHLVPMYDLTYPDSINELKYLPSVYAANFVHCMLYATFVVAGYIGFDPLAPCLMLHACGQLEVVRLRIGKLFPASGFDLKETQRKLGDIVTHLQEIYWYVSSLSNANNVTCT